MNSNTLPSAYQRKRFDAERPHAVFLLISLIVVLGLTCSFIFTKPALAQDNTPKRLPSQNTDEAVCSADSESAYKLLQKDIVDIGTEYDEGKSAVDTGNTERIMTLDVESQNSRDWIIQEIAVAGYSPNIDSLEQLVDVTDEERAAEQNGSGFFLVSRVHNHAVAHENAYLYMVATEHGLYMIGKKDAASQPNPNDVGATQVFEFGGSLIKNTAYVYYNPSTLYDYVLATNDSVDELDSLWQKWVKVDESNVDTIPLLDLSGATAEDPENVMMTVIVYDEPQIPADWTPRLDDVTITSFWSTYEITNNTDNILNKQITGTFGETEALYKAGYANEFLRVPGGKSSQDTRWMGVAYDEFEDENGNGENDRAGMTTWLVNEGQRMCTLFNNIYGEYVVTSAELEPYAQEPIWAPYNTEGGDLGKITDINFYKDVTEVYNNVGESNYQISATSYAPVPGEDEYVDVPQSAWYFDPVKTASTLGYIHGYNELFFGPSDFINRAQIATIMFNMSGWTADSYERAENVDENYQVFPNVATSAYYFAPVMWATQNDVIFGYDNASGEATFEPNDNATREQMCAMVCRYAHLSEGEAHETLTEPEITKILSAYPDADKVSDWARECVAWCVKNGVLSGVKDTATGTSWLAPLDNITRAEAATLAVRFQPEAQTTPLGD